MHKSSISKQLLSVISYCFALAFFIGALGFLAKGTMISGLSLFALAVLLTPPLRARVKSYLQTKYHRNISRRQQIITSAALFLLYIIAAPKTYVTDSITTNPAAPQQQAMLLTQTQTDQEIGGNQITPSPSPSAIPTATPSATPTNSPTPTHTPRPTAIPTKIATKAPTAKPTIKPTEIPIFVTQPPSKYPTEFPCDCSKTCEQISTCSEAQFQLTVCGCKVRDADKDGFACDKAPLNCQP